MWVCDVLASMRNQEQKGWWFGPEVALTKLAHSLCLEKMPVLSWYWQKAQLSFEKWEGSCLFVKSGLRRHSQRFTTKHLYVTMPFETSFPEFI